MLAFVFNRTLKNAAFWLGHATDLRLRFKIDCNRSFCFDVIDVIKMRGNF